MAKIHPADSEAAQNRAIIDRYARSLRLPDLFLAVLPALFLIIFGLFIYLLPQKDFSPKENKQLQTFPPFSLSALFDGTFTADIGDFYADQFPGRTAFIALRGATELSLLKQENNGVLVGSQGYLIKRLECTEAGRQTIRSNLDAIETFAARLSAEDIPFLFSVAPRAIDVLTDHLPLAYDSSRAARDWADITASPTHPLLFTDTLRAMAANGEEVWYHTDHHYTTYGAYVAYRALLPALCGTAPAPLSAFDVQLATDTFTGTTAAGAGLPYVRPDSIYFYRYPGDDDFVTEILDTGKSFSGFYDWEKLTTHDAYSAFLGGNNGHVRVTKKEGNGTADRPTLLLIKDSFAHALAPFLAQHYDLEIIDLRYYVGSTMALAREADAVLLFVGLDSLASAETFRLLNFGK